MCFPRALLLLKTVFHPRRRGFGVRAQAIMALAKGELATKVIEWCADFYTTSECRDLLLRAAQNVRIYQPQQQLIVRDQDAFAAPPTAIHIAVPAPATPSPTKWSKNITKFFWPVKKKRHPGLHGIRLCGISGRARPPDGRAISLDKRAGGPTALASQGALTYHCGKVEPADCHSLKGRQK